MTAIDTKVVRDVWRMRIQLFAIAAVVAAGAGLFLGMRTTMRSLQEAQAEYYAHERFGHVFATCKRAPEHVAKQLAAIPGVQDVQTRVVADVTLDVPGMVEAATARLVSLPDRTRPKVNDIRLRSGRMPRPERGEEVVVSETFAEAHSFPLGTQIAAVINGHWQQLRIVGTALSPEYTYSLPPGSIFPDDRRFGVLWMRRHALGAAFDMQGAFNDVSMRVARGAVPRAVVEQVDAVLDRYGGRGAIERSDQQSHFFVENEFKQIQAQAVMLPVLFLLVAAFLLNVVVGRIISGQREQIAVMKALGYRNRDVAAHFMKLVGLVVAVGLTSGMVVAGWLGSYMTAIYAKYYRFPELPYEMATGEALLTASICVASAAAGTFSAIRRTFRLPPAEAMRPETPPRYGPTLLERWAPTGLTTPAGRMVLRELARKPGRAAGSAVGIAMATALVIVSTFAFDAVQHMLRVQFALTQREDVQLTLAEPRSTGALRTLEYLPGVLHAEPFRSVAARLRAGPRERRVGLQGVPAGATLHAVLDLDLREVELPPDGLLLSRKLAEILDVSIGDVIRVEVLDGSRPTLQVPVARILESYFGLGAIMDLHALCRALDEVPSLNGAWLSVDETAMDDLHRAVKKTPMVAGVTSRDTTVRTVQELMDRSIGTSMTISLTFSLVLAFGVLYNAARITLAERGRELASLRVLGFRRREVASILLGELAVLVAVGLPCGLGLGRVLAAVFAASPGFNNEQFRLPLVIEPSTYGLAAVTVLLAATVSGWAAWRRLDAMDIIQVLKTPD